MLYYNILSKDSPHLDLLMFNIAPIQHVFITHFEKQEIFIGASFYKTN